MNLTSVYIRCKKYNLNTNGSSPTCSSNYVKYGSDYCYNPNSTTSGVLSCSSGYTLNGSNCEKTFYSNKTYSCNTGYTLNGSTCSRIFTETSGILDCSPDYIAINDSLCQKTIIEPDQISCDLDFNYNQETDKCEKIDIKPLL